MCILNLILLCEFDYKVSLLLRIMDVFTKTRRQILEILMPRTKRNIIVIMAEYR